MRYIQFNNTRTIQRSIADIKQQFGLSDEQVSENTELLGLLGKSSNSFMLQVYAAAIILFFLEMIVAEAAAYAITGTICGSVLGIVCNKILFSRLAADRWGDTWSVPLVELGIIIVLAAIAVILAVRNYILKHILPQEYEKRLIFSNKMRLI